MRQKRFSPALSLVLGFSCLMLAGFSLVQFQPVAKGASDSASTYKLAATGSIASGHTGAVNAAGFASDGLHLATASADTLLKVWQISGPAQATTTCTFFNYPAPLVALAWSPDSQLIATGDANGGLRIWSLPCEAHPVNLVGHQGSVRAVAFSPDGRILASGGADNKVRLWEVASRQLIYSFDNGRYGINDLEWSPDGSRLAFVSTSGQLGLLNFAGAATQPGDFRDGTGEALRSLAFSPDGRWLAAGDSKGTIILWDYLHPANKTSFKASDQGSAILSLAFSADSARLAAGGGGNNLKVFQVGASNSGGPGATALYNLQGHTGPVRAVSFGKTGTGINWLLSASEDHTARLWSMTDGAALSTLAGKLAYQTAVSWSPDGKLVLSGANDGAVRVWQAGSGQVAAELPAGVDGEVIRTGAFSGDGRWLAAAGEKGNLYLWPWPVGNKAAPLAQQIIGSQPILALAFSPKISSNNWRLATAGQDGRLRLWNWDGKILKPVASSDTPLRSIRALAFSPDGQAIATGSDDGKIRLWDSATLQLRRAWAAQNAYIKTLAFEGSGTGLASAGGDGSVRVWAVATGQPLAAVQFQTPVEALAFAADGLALAASTQDGAIHLWRPADGRSYLTIEGQGLAALGLAFAPGCHDRLAATTQDGALQIWDLDLQAPGAPEATPPALPAPLASVKAAQFVRIENGHLSLNGQPVKLKGFNFYPHLAPWNAMWQHWDGPQVAADLDKVRDLGANTLRVLVPYGANYEWTQADGTPQPQMLDELEQMIGLAADRNMRVLLTLFDFYGDFPLAGTADEAANWRYLETLAARYRDDPRVLGWDLHNEPDNYTLWQQDNQAQVLSWLARAAQHLRQTDPNHFITIGLGNWQNLSQAGPDGVNALAQEDLVALHDYDATSLDRQIDEVQASGGATLPVVLEEFGWPSAPSELTADYSETTQAGRYRQSLDTIARRNLDGGLAWSLWDFTPNSVLNLKPDIAQQFFGLVRLDGSFKPAAQVWQAAYPATDFALAAEARPATPGLNVRPVDPNLYPLFFPATGFAAPTPFKEYWNRMGGLDSFGYPIGGVRLENGYLVQYFERARFEYHPEGENTPGYASLPKSEQLKHIVLLGLLGREWLGQKGRNFPPAAPLASADQTYFSETAHNLGGRFKLYWQKHGGLARFGFPLSEEIEEVSATDGKRYLVQYFERARFEYHPEAAGTPYEVELGQLGRELS